jgi:hypothetical protein
MKRAAFIVLFLSGVMTVVSGFFSAIFSMDWARHIHVGFGILFIIMIVGHVKQSTRGMNRAA